MSETFTHNNKKIKQSCYFLNTDTLGAYRNIINKSIKIIRKRPIFVSENFTYLAAIFYCFWISLLILTTYGFGIQIAILFVVKNNNR